VYTLSDDLFDLALTRHHQARWFVHGQPSFLQTETAERLWSRLSWVKRPFITGLFVGAWPPAILEQASSLLCAQLWSHAPRAVDLPLTPVVVGDQEYIPFLDMTFDLILSNLVIQGANQILQVLQEARRALKPDGYFLATLAGSRTLFELKRVLLQAEEEITGKAHPRVAPFPDLASAAGLLQASGFALPVADSDVLTVTYPSLAALCRDIQALGGASTLKHRTRSLTHPNLFKRAEELYWKDYAVDNQLRATFDVITLSGWSPSDNQPRPARRGSATVSLIDVLQHNDSKPS